MNEALDIETLIQQARGDKASKDVLLPLYRGYLRFLAGMHLGQKLGVKADASDLVQETLMQAHVAFEQFQGTTEKELLGWLRKILKSRLLLLIRKHTTAQRDYRLEQQLDAELDASAAGLSRAVAADVETPSREVVRRESAVLLADALQQLPDDYREVIALHHVQGLKFNEVAAYLDRSPAATQKLWIRALVKLRDILGEP